MANTQVVWTVSEGLRLATKVLPKGLAGSAEEPRIGVEEGVNNGQKKEGAKQEEDAEGNQKTGRDEVDVGVWYR
jgi:hypothetical protein